MSKKTRKKIARKDPVAASATSAAATDNKPTIRSAIKVTPVVGKAYLCAEDPGKRYQYVKDDLKNIAIIAIPLIVILILPSIFIKI